MKKFIFNYFALFIDGFLIEKQENKFKLLVFLILLSLPLSYLSLNKCICGSLGILGGILTFVGIIIGFLINFLILYLSLGDTKYLKRLKKEIYELPQNKKELRIGEEPITVYQYILSKIFFTIGIGLFLSMLIFIAYITCYADITQCVTPFFRNIIKLIFSTLVIGTSFYFILYTYRLINKFYMLLFVYVKK